MIDQPAWVNIRSGIRESKVWFFQLIFRKNRHSWSYLFFFGKHYWTDLDNDQDRSEPRVCLLISAQIGGQDSVRLDQAKDTAVMPKEAFVVRKNFCSRRFAPSMQDAEVFGP